MTLTLGDATLPDLALIQNAHCHKNKLQDPQPPYRNHEATLWTLQFYINVVNIYIYKYIYIDTGKDIEIEVEIGLDIDKKIDT